MLIKNKLFASTFFQLIGIEFSRNTESRRLKRYCDEFLEICFNKTKISGII